MNAPRPSWQHEPCPPWCVTEHHEDDLLGDRFHDSAGTYLTVSVPDEDAPAGTSAAELFLSRFRRVGEPEEWIHLEVDAHVQPGLTISPESARALARTLLAVAGTD